MTNVLGSTKGMPIKIGKNVLKGDLKECSSLEDAALVFQQIFNEIPLEGVHIVPHLSLLFP